jgi:hypothetical protein
MTGRVDFHAQAGVDGGDDGMRRPNITVHLPTGRDIVVDSQRLGGLARRPRPAPAPAARAARRGVREDAWRPAAIDTAARAVSAPELRVAELAPAELPAA